MKTFFTVLCPFHGFDAQLTVYAITFNQFTIVIICDAHTIYTIIQAHGFSYHFYAEDTQLYLSFRPDDPMVAAWISGCLADISAWMKEHHLQLNLAKTELLVFPATPTLQHDFMVQLG